MLPTKNTNTHSHIKHTLEFKTKKNIPFSMFFVLFSLLYKLQFILKKRFQDSQKNKIWVLL